MQVLCALSPLHVISEALHPARLVPESVTPRMGEPAPAHDAGDGGFSDAPALTTIDEASQEDDQSSEGLVSEWFGPNDDSPLDPALTTAARAIVNEQLEPIDEHDGEL